MTHHNRPDGSGLPLWSPDWTDDIRSSAAMLHCPLYRTRPIQADALAATRNDHIAATRGDTNAKVVARIQLLDATERVEEELDRAADCYLSIAALDFDRRRAELPDQLRQLLAAITDPIFERLANIENLLTREETLA